MKRCVKQYNNPNREEEEEEEEEEENKDGIFSRSPMCFRGSTSVYYTPISIDSTFY
jgi:hypothetical protein